MKLAGLHIDRFGTRSDLNLSGIADGLNVVFELGHILDLEADAQLVEALQHLQSRPVMHSKAE